MERIVLHLDLDYFFAQVEENERSELKGKPLVVCVYSGRTKESGVVSTSNYEARKYLVKSGMPIMEAIAKLKNVDAVFLPVRHERYAEISQGVMEILSRYGERFEYASIDEGILEITEASGGNYENAEKIAEKIKREISGKFHLTCSVGIGPNRLIAKIASDFRKPDGLTVVKPNEVEEFLEGMDVGKIPGIGRKSSEFLFGLGVRTIGALQKADPTLIVEAFGKKIGGWLINAAKGIDESEVGVLEGQKQISRITTLKRDTRNLEEIMKVVEPLIADISKEMKERNISFESIGVTLIDRNLKTYAKTRALPHPSGNAHDAVKIFEELFGAIIKETKTNFRRAGIKVEKLESKKGQKTLDEF